MVQLHILLHYQVTWLKDGSEISLRDRLYTQTVRTVGREESRRVGLASTEESRRIASLSVSSLRRNATFTCRIYTDPPQEKTLQVYVRGEALGGILLW